MTAEVLGTMISTAVAFTGMAGIFLIANLAFKAMGLGPVFMRPEDDPARKKSKTDPVILSDQNETKTGAEIEDPARPERMSGKKNAEALSELSETPVVRHKTGRLRTGLRRARLLTTVIVFGLSVFSAFTFLHDETPEWASRCGWQISGKPELSRDEERRIAQAKALSDVRRLSPFSLNESSYTASNQQLADQHYFKVLERGCWYVTEVRLKAIGLALLPALLFFLTTLVLVSLGRWLFVVDQPRPA